MSLASLAIGSQLDVRAQLELARTQRDRGESRSALQDLESLASSEVSTIAAEALNEYEGIIDKFMGDAVMALFNTQLNPMEDHVDRAVRAGLKMQHAVMAYRESLPENERLFFSAGIHTGEAVAGNVGSSFRKDFTAIGDAVNLAKRLEETATSQQIVISQAVYEKVKEWVVVEAREPMQVKGRQALEQTYLLVDEK